MSSEPGTEPHSGPQTHSHQIKGIRGSEGGGSCRSLMVAGEAGYADSVLGCQSQSSFRERNMVGVPRTKTLGWARSDAPPEKPS